MGGFMQTKRRVSENKNNAGGNGSRFVLYHVCMWFTPQFRAFNVNVSVGGAARWKQHCWLTDSDTSKSESRSQTAETGWEWRHRKSLVRQEVCHWSASKNFSIHFYHSTNQSTLFCSVLKQTVVSESTERPTEPHRTAWRSATEKNSPIGRNQEQMLPLEGGANRYDLVASLKKCKRRRGRQRDIVWLMYDVIVKL